MFPNYIIIQNQAPYTHMCVFYISRGFFIISLEMLPICGSKSKTGVMAVNLQLRAFYCCSCYYTN